MRDVSRPNVIIIVKVKAVNGSTNREKKHEEQGRGKKKGGTTEWGGKMDERNGEKFTE